MYQKRFYLSTGSLKFTNLCSAFKFPHILTGTNENGGSTNEFLFWSLVLEMIEKRSLSNESVAKIYP